MLYFCTLSSDVSEKLKVNYEWNGLKLAETEKALMIWDAFKAQKTEAVEKISIVQH